MMDLGNHADDDTDTTGRRNLEETIVRAFKMMKDFSKFDPLDNNNDRANNPWNNPQQIFDQIERARKEIMDIWEESHNNFNKSDDDVGSSTSGDDDDDEGLKSLYLEGITDAFGDVLDELRKNNVVDDMALLVDYLQSGMEFLTSGEVKLLVK